MALKEMTAKQVAEKVINKQNLFILDVRNEEAHQDWKIEGDSVETINVPYFELLEGVDDILDQLPDDTEKLVVCAKEGSSKFVAEQLVEAGVENVSYLQGGMKSWSEHLEPVKIGDLKDGGAIYQFVRIGKGCLSYLVESNGEAMIIDSNRMTEPYEKFVSENDLKVKYLADTHLHADHISGGRTLAELFGAEYYLPPKDATEVTFDYNQLEEGNDLTVGNTSIQVQPIYSPGHTIGSTSFIVDDQYLLTGDILFVKSIGRPDLAGKAEDWVGDLRDTLYRKYKDLSDELVVLPAHFSKVTELNNDGSVKAKLGTLYAENTGLNVDDEGEFRKMVTENLPPQPNAYQEIRETNMGKINPEEEEQREMEIGPNRCAVEG
ncbi:MBL fold metallo-hydrolase [Pseudalkalibacillus berkeleyi]|uniref:MBL fold metallo-hydrolase n=1 Tax=Pseudalkalibacillus berkeleyi TaxID=1069813 RepID=A0ABS9H618_9BACL|nr:MBL fold metallo-hydrolase [Pseudalkalibacillus berkeleyi]MCF6139394.1 MBL fold metallo-hydrolase [Pseudalkalibacillus berkeleyi]